MRMYAISGLGIEKQNHKNCVYSSSSAVFLPRTFLAKIRSKCTELIYIQFESVFLFLAF